MFALNTTFFCDQKPHLLTTLENVVEHALAVMSLENASEWTVFQIIFSEHGLLEDVRWRFLTDADLKSMNPEKLQERKSNLLESRKHKKTTVLPGTKTKVKF